MSIRRNLYLVTSSLAVAGMIGAPLQGYAQDAGPPDQSAPYTQSQSEDPPARVGRLGTIEGTVSTHAASETQWTPAVLNAPVSTGDSFWTEPQATAEIEVGASSLWMDSSTEVDLTTLNDTAMTASEPQGEVYLHLRAISPGETYTIQTPRGAVTVQGEGRYDIFAGDTQNPTTVTVLDGEAEISGTNVSLRVEANQTATITGSDTFAGQVGPIQQDAFLARMLARERPVAVQGVAPPPVVAQMTGGEDLNAYGSWSTEADYGTVWYPSVSADWAPYREGRWSYVAPWGWTWVDAAPWGFAPFHYGRWVQVGPRWGWVPVYPGYAPSYRPVYAPALVSFFGVGVAVGVGVGIGFGLNAAFGPGAHVGWVPLGPREAYYPPYRASNIYVNRVNITNIRNVTNITNEVNIRRNMTVNRFANARAATVVPASAMVDSRPVAGNFTRIQPNELASARPLVNRPPVAPGARTIGLTPRVAQQMNLRPAEPPRAPGPKLEQGPAGGSTRPALRPSEGPRRPGAPGIAAPNQPGPAQRPGLPASAPPPQARPGAAAGPQLGRPNAGRPELRAPGASPLAPRGPGIATPRPDAGRPTAQAPRPTPQLQRPIPQVQRPSTAPAPIDHPRRRPEPAQPRPAAPTPRPEAPRPQVQRPEVQRPEVQRPQVQRPDIQRPQIQRPEARPEPRPEAPRPQMQRPEAPRPQAPRPEPQRQPDRNPDKKPPG